MTHRSPARRLAPLAVLALLAAAPSGVTAAPSFRADVAVIVDTSLSMREAGMDPQRSSLLVTKLLSDLVPGELAVVRLLDLTADAGLLPQRRTGTTQPCAEDPSQECESIEPASDWEQDARRLGFGVLRRPARGDAAFKKALEQHLEQRSNNSPFYLAFRASQGVFDAHRDWNTEVPRVVVWLSDGRPENEAPLRAVIRDLTTTGIDVEAVLFGAGDPRAAEEAGLAVRRTRGPAELVKAFADIFRRIVQAPYRLDGPVASAPRFTIKPHVDEAWVVVYGDDTLGAVSLLGPDGSHDASYASDRWPGAGAYRVAHFETPRSGAWTVRVEGGGPDAAYAVIQRSALSPLLLAPTTASAGVGTRLVAGVAAGADGRPLTDPDLLSQITLTAMVEGRTLSLADDGRGADEKAGDGRFSAPFTFGTPGRIPVEIALRSDLVDRRQTASVSVAGSFRLTHPPSVLDLGTLQAGTGACGELRFAAEQNGTVGFALQLLREIPPGHRLHIHLPTGDLLPGGDPHPAAPGDRFEVCLETGRQAPSSEALGEPWLELRAAGGSESAQRVPVALRWHVQELSFWQRWGWLLLLLAAVLTTLFVALGFVLPQRFQRGLALALASERGDLEDQTPQPIKQWPGVRIGFYRHARAFLHADYRVSGEPRGALAALRAERGGARVAPGRTAPLCRETLDGDWEPVAAVGRRARGGDVFRVAESGPYFRVSLRGGVR